MITPKVHILILNWNGKDILYDCINSIFNSDYRNYEVTIIDNGSTDNSINKVKTDFEKLNFILIKDNLGYSKGYNYAFNKLKKSIDDYYFLLNNDTIIKKNTISNLINAISIFGKNNIYGPKILNNLDESIWYGGGRISNITKLASHIALNKKNIVTEMKSQKTDFVSGCAMLVPKKIIDTIGGFNELYNFYYEDVDLCLKAKNQGSLCFFISDSIVIHKISSSIGGRYSLSKLRHMIISTLKYLYSNYDIISFFIYSIINLLLLPFKIIFKFLRLAIK